MTPFNGNGPWTPLAKGGPVAIFAGILLYYLVFDWGQDMNELKNIAREQLDISKRLLTEMQTSNYLHNSDAFSLVQGISKP